MVTAMLKNCAVKPTVSPNKKTVWHKKIIKVDTTLIFFIAYDCISVTIYSPLILSKNQ